MLSSGAKELQLGETEVSDVGGDGGNGYPNKLKSRSATFVARVMPLLKIADHHQHTVKDLEQAASELFSRHYTNSKKLQALRSVQNIFWFHVQMMLV